ncbi:uncharacterized protein ATNIH1004_011651 [Aspergillus tanneri]|uniref:Uncharacterized protein n=1 Tax=Aspergillus tanneri TaxID=1220188 RepID=A0A5M9M3F2_9EURO|nr:uncharacterized protein ATNIH1004_011651 [Aspergillus tanneri]KAA8641515.1 hypothetical protein ATNIH1004_011651 [Aspergillus tanneri]
MEPSGLFSDVYGETDEVAARFEESASTILSALSGCRTSLQQMQKMVFMWHEAYRNMEEKASQTTEVNYKLCCKIRALEEYIESLQYRIYHPTECSMSDHALARWRGYLGDSQVSAQYLYGSQRLKELFNESSQTVGIGDSKICLPTLCNLCSRFLSMTTNNAELGRPGYVCTTLATEHESQMSRKMLRLYLPSGS